MTDKELYDECFEEAGKVDFIKKRWERNLYASSLYLAKLWGMKKTKENKDYFKRNHFIDKYNV